MTQASTDGGATPTYSQRAVPPRIRSNEPADAETRGATPSRRAVPPRTRGNDPADAETRGATPLQRAVPPRIRSNSIADETYMLAGGSQPCERQPSRRRALRGWKGEVPVPWWDRYYR